MISPGEMLESPARPPRVLRAPLVFAARRPRTGRSTTLATSKA
jgi:hypothetical protein